MPIDNATLQAIASAYTGAMTPIRGRRVHRLLMRAFVSFDQVLPASTEDGRAALLALAEDGRAAVCCTDGRGAAAEVTEWASLCGASVATAFDLAKDSLPVLHWTLGHPGLARLGGALRIDGGALGAGEHRTVADLLRRSLAAAPGAA